MTVKELIKQLETLPPNQTVVTDLHSEFAEIEKVELMVGVENGGYISRPYGEEQSLRARGYVFIGVAS